MTLSYHGLSRMKERSGFGKSATKITRIANKALEKGLSHKETKGSLRKYLDERYVAYGTGNNMKIYGGNLYIFEDDTLITMFALPGKLQRQASKYKKAA